MSFKVLFDKISQIVTTLQRTQNFRRIFVDSSAINSDETGYSTNPVTDINTALLYSKYSNYTQIILTNSSYTISNPDIYLTGITEIEAENKSTLYFLKPLTLGYNSTLIFRNITFSIDKVILKCQDYSCIIFENCNFICNTIGTLIVIDSGVIRFLNCTASGNLYIDNKGPLFVYRNTNISYNVTNSDLLSKLDES